MLAIPPMLTVSILINGEPLYTRSCVNTGEVKNGRTMYRVDTGVDVWHDIEDGAVPLAQKLLKTIDPLTDSGK